MLEAYHLTNGEVSFRDTVVKPIAGMLTIGLGGSAGPEGPSLLAGGGVASQIAKHLKVRSDLRRRLFVAGAAAGLAATFRTPLTGILFALEIPTRTTWTTNFIEANHINTCYLLSVALLVRNRSLRHSVAGVNVGCMCFHFCYGAISGYTRFLLKPSIIQASLARSKGKIRRRRGCFALCIIDCSFRLNSIYSFGVGLHS